MSTGASQIRTLVERATEAAGDIAIFCVANVQQKAALTSSYERSIEYFTEKELDQIVEAFRVNDFYCDVFVGEDEFLKWALGGGAQRFPRKHVLVYNTAQSGSGAGRKSLIPAFCALHGLTTLNGNPYVVSLARHKYHVNAILNSVGIPVARTWWYLGARRWLHERRPPTGLLVLAKSTYESASIGISQRSALALNEQSEEQLDEMVAELAQPVVVQEFIAGREAETPIIAGPQPIVLAPVGISINGENNLDSRFLSYERVAVNGYGFYDFGTDCPQTADRLRQIAALTAAVLQLEGFCRVDCRISDAGQPFVTDVSTTPHLVTHSAFDFRFRDFGGRDVMMAALAGWGLSRSVLGPEL
jgi:D-alanine-D-alanine ligase